MTKSEEKLARAELKRVATSLSVSLIPALEAVLLESSPGVRTVLIADWLDVSTGKNNVKLAGRIAVLGPVDSKFISNMVNTLIGDKPALEDPCFTDLDEKTESY